MPSAIQLFSLLTITPSLLSATVLTSTFEDLTPDTPFPAGGAYYNGEIAATGETTGYHDGSFTSSGTTFSNNFGAQFRDWVGFAFSTTTDATTPGWGNQYSSITGAGAVASLTYAIAFGTAPGGPRIDFPSTSAPRSVEITNTTYTGLTLRDGDAFSKKFGGADGNDPDYFRLTIDGWLGDAPAGSVTVSLADFTSPDPAGDFILDSWLTVDLTPIGTADYLTFSFDSTDVGQFGINTPLYAAIDNLSFEVVPEPTALAFLGLATALVTMFTRSRRASR